MDFFYNFDMNEKKMKIPKKTKKIYKNKKKQKNMI